MTRNTELEALLGRVFDGLREGLGKSVPADEYERLKSEFIFHMTDWQDDLAQFAGLVLQPAGWTEESASALVVGFLYHVVPHLVSARRLLLDDHGSMSLESVHASADEGRSRAD